jgi:hypothetical protein
MTTRMQSILALVTIGAALVAAPALAAGSVAGARASGDLSVNRDAPLTLPGPVAAGATPHVDTASLSRGLFGDDPASALASLGTTTLSRDGTISETPASDVMRGIFESTVQGKKKS